MMNRLRGLLPRGGTPPREEILQVLELGVLLLQRREVLTLPVLLGQNAVHLVPQLVLIPHRVGSREVQNTQEKPHPHGRGRHNVEPARLGPDDRAGDGASDDGIPRVLLPPRGFGQALGRGERPAGGREPQGRAGHHPNDGAEVGRVHALVDGVAESLGRDDRVGVPGHLHGTEERSGHGAHHDGVHRPIQARPRDLVGPIDRIPPVILELIIASPSHILLSLSFEGADSLLSRRCGRRTFPRRAGGKGGSNSDTKREGK
mmetsp:Transcript_14618/g.42850  ORF Transcript_14618/g.42850 Transcript_14618/m.42850 type:complete len:260 (-) Transcript_14618:10-789(-)